MKKTALIIPAIALVAVVSLPLASRAAGAEKIGNGFGRGRGAKIELTAEQKAKLDEQRQAREAEMTAKRQQIDSAIEAGDYEAWLKAVGTACPLAGKITKDNFAQYQEIHNLRKQLEAKVSALGLEREGEAHPGFRGMPGAR